MLRKSTLREIRASLGRYLAIMAIVALGVGFFAGLKVCKESMVQTAQNYLDEFNLFDQQLISTLGYDEDSVDRILAVPGVRDAEGSISHDVIVNNQDGSTAVYKAFLLPSRINTLRLLYGRLPERDDECVLDSGRGSEKMLGTTISLSDNNDEDTLEPFRYREYKVVGIAASPLYINFERGSGELGDGTISGFFCIPEDGFDTDYYTSIYVTLDQDEQIYSDEYQAAIDSAEPKVKKAAKAATAARYDDVVSKAQIKLDKKIKEYEDGVQEYEEEKADVYAELADAKKQIEDGEKELKKNKKKLKENKKKLKANEKKLKKNEKKLKKNLNPVRDQKSKIEEGLKEIDKKEAQIDAAIAQIDQAAAGMKDMDPNDPAAAAAAAAAAAKRKQLVTAKAQLKAKRKELKKAHKQVTSGLKQVDSGLAQIAEGKKQVEDGKKKIAKGEKEIKKGEKKLKKARKEYNEGLEEADREFAEAKADLDEAKRKLDKAQRKINKIKRGKTYVLDRNTNIGYATFESNADIVNSVARIFPLFFFLVAGLVCMTTMTRMIDDQRTQIGVLKALGYSNQAVLGKYLFYSGSAAAIGAVGGFFLGCWLFPAVIWKAYGMMLNFADRPCVFIINWPLFLACIAVALLCSMGATWFSCESDFRVAPAMLIRPKAPKSGKRILLERIGPLWNRIGFLYKVSLRNIFRYKKRFFMMVVGISGCTALLIAAFGINTSVKDFAAFQFDEVALYDAQITFDDHMTAEDQEEFLDYAGERCRETLFLHQQDMDMVVGGKTFTVTLVATDGENFRDFIDLHDRETPIDYPGDGEAVVCRKMQAHYGVEPGDTITLRKGIKEMTVKVSAICDNYLYNYVYINDNTYEEGFGKAPEIKTALIEFTAGESAADAGSSAVDQPVKPSAGEIRQAAAHLAGHDRCTSVFVNADMVNRVENMMSSLNAVILLVIFCAGLLAFIVLYNLTNINITERIREIATIKVLGFYPFETSSYVFRENFFLTGISALVGIPLGNMLLQFVMSEIRVDMVFFEPRLTGLDYLWSVLLTFLFACVVSLVMIPRLSKISMTESLKSIE